MFYPLQKRQVRIILLSKKINENVARLRSTLQGTRTLFTTIHFLPNSQMGPLS
jgi:hypothetical protein